MRLLVLVGLAAIVLGLSPAHAQQQVIELCRNSSGVWAPCSPSNPPPGPSSVVSTIVVGATTSITTGGTSQTLFTAGTVTNGGFVTNPATATEVLCVNPVGTAATVTASAATFCLAAGQTFVLPIGQTNAVTVNATTTAHAFSAVRY